MNSSQNNVKKDLIIVDMTSKLKPEEVFDIISDKLSNQCKYEAIYSGDKKKLRLSLGPGTFWCSSDKRKVHLPIAAELANTSADLLFGEKPSISLIDNDGKNATDEMQNRWETIADNNDFISELHYAAVLASVNGDVYAKININEEFEDEPLINIVQSKFSHAEYRYNRLIAIHFITYENEHDAKKKEGEKVRRIYERYSQGEIYSCVYEGTKSKLGIVVEKTKQQIIFEDTKTIFAMHVPNVRPNRNSLGSKSGSSDFSSIELIDAIDEGYSSWLRDIRLGKAILVVPAQYLKPNVRDSLFPSGSTKPAVNFKNADEVFVALDIDADKESTNGGVKNVQFEIRSEQHKAFLQESINSLITGAGYSPATFGLQIYGTAESGTALFIRERKTYQTLGRKRTTWKKRLEAFFAAICEIDNYIWGHNYGEKDDEIQFKPTIEFKDYAVDLSVTAPLIKQLFDSDSISLYERVKKSNPSWDDNQITEEINRIIADKKRSAQLFTLGSLMDGSNDDETDNDEGGSDDEDANQEDK